MRLPMNKYSRGEREDGMGGGWEKGGPHLPHTQTEL